jgi:hypothetical protein
VKGSPPSNIAVKWNLQWHGDTTFNLQLVEDLDLLAGCLHLQTMGIIIDQAEKVKKLYILYLDCK